MSRALEKWLIRKFVKSYDDPMKNRESYGTMSSFVGVFCNTSLFLIKIIVGMITGSISLIADGVNNLSDVGTNIATLLGFRMSGKPADKEHPFGHGRTEYLSALTVSVVILLLGYELMKSSIVRILHPVAVEMSLVGAVLIFLTMLVKVWLSRFYSNIAKKIGSQALTAAAMDSRNDVLATGLVLLSFGVARLTGLMIDGIAGLMVAIFILYNGFQFVRETMSTLIGIQPEDGLMEKIHDYMVAYDVVINAHDIIVHDYGPLSKMVSAHVEISAEYSLVVAHEIVDRIERDIMEDMGISLVVHIDPVEVDTEACVEIKEGIEKYLKGYGQDVKIRDFRIWEEENVVLFDLVFPETFEGNLEHMKTSINLYLKSKYPYDFLLNLRKEKLYMN